MKTAFQKLLAWFTDTFFYLLIVVGGIVFWATIAFALVQSLFK